MLCDLNGFKALNDAHGHAAGDAALEQIGAVLACGLRRADAAYRIGGDEFALLLPETTADHAAAVVERISDAMSAAFTGHMAGLEASFGIAVCPTAGCHPARPLPRRRRGDVRRQAPRPGARAATHRLRSRPPVGMRKVDE